MGEKEPLPPEATGVDKDEEKKKDKTDEYETFTDSRGGVHTVKKGERQKYIDELREAEK